MCTVITIWWRGALIYGINVHGNYYYMVEGALTCGSHVVINVHSIYYYMVEGSPSHMAINVHCYYYYMV